MNGDMFRAIHENLGRKYKICVALTAAQCPDIYGPIGKADVPIVRDPTWSGSLDSVGVATLL